MRIDTPREANTREVIHVLVGDNTPMAARLLADALRRLQRLEVVGFASSSSAVIKEVDATRPHVAVISTAFDNEPLKGLEVSAQLCSLHPELKSIMLLDRSQRDLVTGAFRSGAKAVFCRDEPIKVLCKCIESVDAGKSGLIASNWGSYSRHSTRLRGHAWLITKVTRCSQNESRPWLRAWPKDSPIVRQPHS